jgi:hypothetical protein
MVSSTIWENMHKYLYLIIFIHGKYGNQVSIDDSHRAVSQRRSKLHESEGQVQFEVFEKLTRLYVFPNRTRNHTITNK